MYHQTMNIGRLFYAFCNNVLGGVVSLSRTCKLCVEKILNQTFEPCDISFKIKTAE